MTKTRHLRVIGDIHGEYLTYKKLINSILGEGMPLSICVGDVGHDYNFLLENVDATKHRAIGGNHDNYDIIDQVPHFLGDFGELETNLFKLFFVRGAWSIDHKWRESYSFLKKKKVYWPDKEELSLKEGEQALLLYKNVKPSVLISHECPLSIVQYVTNPDFVQDFGYSDPVIKTRTNQLLEVMRDFHKPKIHLFGHYHKRWYKMIDNTLFICVASEECVDFYDNGEIYYGVHKLEYNWKDLMAN